MKMRILLTGVALTAMLAACDRKPDTPATVDAAAATLPLTAEEQLAPSADALPEAPPAPLAQAPANYDEDAYWDEASRADDYYDDRAPDYAFDYGREEPAAWTDGGDILRMVERLAGGGERYYYYRRGEDRPYYVRDPDYAYGYDRGRLVTVYDARTRRALAREDASRRSEQAGRYLARSQELRRAAARTDAQDRRQLDRAQYRQWQQREDIRDQQERARDQAQDQQRAREAAERDRAEQERDRLERDRDRDRLDRDRGDRDRDRAERDRDRGERDRDRDRPPVVTPPVVAKPAPTPAPAPKPAPAPVFKPTPQAQRPDGGRIFDDRKGPDRVQPRPAPAVRPAPVAKPAPAPAAKPAPAAIAKPAPAPQPVVKAPAAPAAKPAPVAVAKPAPVAKPKPKPALAGKDMTPAERKAARDELRARLKGTPEKQEQ